MQVILEKVMPVTLSSINSIRLGWRNDLKKSANISAMRSTVIRSFLMKKHFCKSHKNDWLDAHSVKQC